MRKRYGKKPWMQTRYSRAYKTELYFARVAAASTALVGAQRIEALKASGELSPVEIARVTIETFAEVMGILNAPIKKWRVR